MRKTSIKRKTIAGIATLVLVVAGLSLSSAYAANQIDLSKSCSLTVSVADAGAFSEDLATAKLQANVYRVASVDAYGSYTALTGYETLKLEEMLKEEVSQSEVAQEAVKLVENKAADVVISIEEGKGIAENLEAGMYLVTVDKGETEDYIYTFNPYFICLPDNLYSRTEKPEDNYYQYDAVAGLKPEQSPRFGKLKVSKTLDAYNESLQDVTFVFEITAVDEDGTVVYSNVVSTTHNSAGTKEVVVDNIPAGTTVTVTEVYSGASYQTKSAASATAVVTAEEIATVKFTNTYTDELVSGYGVTNHFEYDEAEGWQWTRLSDNTTVTNSAASERAANNNSTANE